MGFECHKLKVEMLFEANYYSKTLRHYHLLIDCSKKCCGPECKSSPQSNGNVGLYIGVAVGVCVLITISIIVAVFIIRKQNSGAIDNPKHNTYLEPTSGIDMTNISTIENDSYHTTPAEQDSYHTIPYSHFDYMNGDSNVRTNMENS